jgi:arylformamidase
MDDKGLLGNHRIFWGDGLNANSEVNPDSQKTITELAYIPNRAKDGLYFLNIQIPHFVCDAAPSRPLLYSVV